MALNNPLGLICHKTPTNPSTYFRVKIVDKLSKCFFPIALNHHWLLSRVKLRC